MQPWQPADPLEEQLLEAMTAGDDPTTRALVQAAQLLLPVTAAAFAGDEPPAWPTVATPDQRTWIVAYTSLDSVRLGTNNAFQHARASSLAELAAGWPDHSWALTINPGLPLHLNLELATIARLAAPSLLEDRAVMPEARMPLMQKLLSYTDLAELLLGTTVVSGYCHQAIDAAHITTPRVLVEALGRSADMAELINDRGSATVVRWPAVGLELYPNAYGGTDEPSRAAVDGWLIEEPPFVGLGFGPNIDQVIREYKITGVRLPHGTEVYELADDGSAERRAYLDLDIGHWLLIQPPGTTIDPDSVEAEQG